MSKIAVIGMVGSSAFLSVPAFHQGGETVVADSVHFEPGSKGFNQAVAAARYGAEVSFLAAVGDSGGDEIAAFAAREGIDAHLIRKPGQTAYAAILTDATGANRVTVCQGVTLEEQDVDAFAMQIAAADVLLINNEVPEALNVRAVQIARQNGTFVLCNPAPARPMCPYLLDHIDLFTPNEYETEPLGERTNLVVTLGGKGCLLAHRGRIIPACSLGPAVDTTGAGDTFSGVLAAELSLGMPLSEAAFAATVAAGISVTRPYAVSSIPGGKEIKAAMAQINAAKA